MSWKRIPKARDAFVAVVCTAPVPPCGLMLRQEKGAVLSLLSVPFVLSTTSGLQPISLERPRLPAGTGPGAALRAALHRQVCAQSMTL